MYGGVRGERKSPLLDCAIRPEGGRRARTSGHPTGIRFSGRQMDTELSG